MQNCRLIWAGVVAVAALAFHLLVINEEAPLYPYLPGGEALNVIWGLINIVPGFISFAAAVGSSRNPHSVNLTLSNGLYWLLLLIQWFLLGLLISKLICRRRLRTQTPDHFRTSRRRT